MALSETLLQPDSYIQSGSMLDFHSRFTHLSYYTFKRTAGDPENRIRLTTKERTTCLTCDHDKQRHSHMDTELNAPIIRLGGVICSDIKVPITPTDRLGNRYMINSLTTRLITATFSSPRQMTRQRSSLSSFSSTLRSDLNPRSTAYA